MVLTDQQIEIRNNIANDPTRKESPPPTKKFVCASCRLWKEPEDFGRFVRLTPIGDDLAYLNLKPGLRVKRAFTVVCASCANGDFPPSGELKSARTEPGV